MLLGRMVLGALCLGFLALAVRGAVRILTNRVEGPIELPPARVGAPPDLPRLRVRWAEVIAGVMEVVFGTMAGWTAGVIFLWTARADELGAATLGGVGILVVVVAAVRRFRRSDMCSVGVDGGS